MKPADRGQWLTTTCVRLCPLQTVVLSNWILSKATVTSQV